MKYLVPFSGGLDSTYLVYKLLRDGHTVDLMYIEILNNKNKTQAEFAVRELLIDEFKKEFPERVNVIYNHNSIEVSRRTSTECTQAVIWLSIVIMTLRNERGYFYDAIAFGYVQGDTMLSFIDDMQESYAALCKFENLKYGERYPVLEFPIKKLCKRDMFDGLSNRYTSLIWSCEEPHMSEDGVVTRCGDCNPCNTQKHYGIYDRSRDTISTRRELLSNLVEPKVEDYVESKAIDYSVLHPIEKQVEASHEEARAVQCEIPSLS